MDKSQLIYDIYMKHGTVSKEYIKKILVEEYHILNESQADLLAEEIFSGIKDLGIKVLNAISILTKKLGGAVVKQVKKFGTLLLSFSNKNWEGYAEPNTGTIITGIYTKTGNKEFGSDAKKNPVVFINNKIKNTQPIPEAFIQKLFNEIILNEAQGEDEIGVTNPEHDTKRYAALSKEIRKADIEANSRAPVVGWNSPEITIEQYAKSVLPRFMTQVESRSSDTASIPSFMIVGPPGVAKTYYVRALEGIGSKVAIWELSREQDFSIQGIPVVDKDTHIPTVSEKDDKDGPNKFHNEKDERTGTLVTRFARPSRLPDSKDKRNCIFFFDEFNRAQPKVLNAVMNFVQSGELADYKIPVHSGHIFAANAGDGIIDTELVQKIANSMLERIGKTYVMRHSMKALLDRGVSIPEDDEEENTKSRNAINQLRSQLDLDKDNKRNINAIPEKVKNTDWEEDLGGKISSSEITGYANYKNPINEKNYIFPMGAGGKGSLTPIIANWVKYRYEGKTGTYEQSDIGREFTKEDDTSGKKRIKTTGDNATLPVKSFVFGQEEGGGGGGEDITDLHLIGTPRELEKYSQAMRQDSLYDFMSSWLYGTPLPKKLQVKKPIQYFIDNWKDNGYLSAPHYFLSVNQEYYVQFSAVAVATKTKEDQDVLVQDILGFYDTERKAGQFLDKEHALYAFSVFRPEQIEMILKTKRLSDSELENAEEGYEKRMTAQDRISDIREAFTNDLSGLLNSFTDTKDFVSKAKKAIATIKEKMQDYDKYIDYDMFMKEINGSEDEVLAFVVENIEAVIQTLEIQINGVINMMSEEKMKTEFAIRVAKGFMMATDIGSRVARSSGSEARTGKKSKEAISVDDIMSGLFGSSESNDEAPVEKKRRGRPPKAKNENLDDVSLGFIKLFENMK
jgi:hypothetical protein